jgi:heavy metal sensor kinase
MFTRSIRWRMQLWQSFLLVCILTGFGVTAYQLQRINAIRQIDEELENRVASIVGDIRGRGPLRGALDRPSPEDVRDTALGPRRSGTARGPGGPGGADGLEGMNGPGGRGGHGGPGADWGPGGGPDRGPGPRARGGWFEELFEGRQVRLSAATLARFATGETNDFYFTVWSPGGNALSRSSNAPPAMARPSAGKALTGIHAYAVEDRREAYQFTGPGYCVVVGRSITRDLATLRAFGWWLAMAGGAVLTLGLGGGWILAGRALAPVEKISAAAGRISAGSLSERIDVTETESELGRLAGILNSTFARLETAFAQQQQFTADASHELRTPIAVIISEAQTALARERSGPEYRATIEVCLDAAQQMRRLARSLLELARYDAGQESIERGPFDLAETAQACADLISPLIREQGLALRAEFASAPMVGDADRIAQVITNLLTNAITYNRPQGEIRISTRVEATQTVLEVADSGVGIPEADLPHVFERFYRVDKSRGRNQGHQGLGLAICRAVVEAHAGTIDVTSEHGVGTTFTVRFPAPPSP